MYHVLGMCSPSVPAGKAQMHPVVLRMCLRLPWIRDTACVAAAAAAGAIVVAASGVSKIPFSFRVVRATLVSAAEAVAAFPFSPALLGPKLAVATEEDQAAAVATSHWHAGPGRDAARRYCDSASLRLAMYGRELLGR